MSKFSFFLAPVWNKTPQGIFTLTDAYDYIRGGKAAETTLRLRSFADKKEARAYKTRAFDYVTFSGVFDHCSDDALTSHSQLLCLDFDHIEDVEALRQRLLADSLLTTRLLFTSPSGDGLKWVVDIDTAQCPHRQWFAAIRNYLSVRYGLEADEKCVNVSRACFLPHDPNVILNNN